MARKADPQARTSLLASARREFVRAGLARARVEDITQAVGLSKGAFYLHFESKDALFRELVAELKAEILAHAKSRQDAWQRWAARLRRGRTPLRLTHFSEFHAVEDARLLELLWRWRDVLEVLLRGTAGTEFESVMWTVIDAHLARQADEVRQLQKLGLIREDLPAELLGNVVIGTYLLVTRQLVLSADKPDFGPFVSALQLVLSNGLGPVRRRATPSRKRK